MLAADSQLARCNSHRAARKSATNTNLATHPGTPLDTVDAMVNSPGHVGVDFAEKRHGLCETEVRRFQTSKKGPNASSDLAKTPVRPPFSIGTHERTTKLRGVGVRLGLIKRDGLGAGALGLLAQPS